MGLPEHTAQRTSLVCKDINVYIIQDSGFCLKAKDGISHMTQKPKLLYCRISVNATAN